MSAAQASAWIDGACRGNPGDAGFGVLFDAGGVRHEIAGFLGRTTNNVAEYAALIAALSFADQQGFTRVKLFSDSQLLVRQISGAYRVKAAHLVPLFLKILQLRRKIPHFELHHVPRQQNTEADSLANQAIDSRLPPPDWLELELPSP